MPFFLGGVYSAEEKNGVSKPKVGCFALVEAPRSSNAAVHPSQLYPCLIRARNNLGLVGSFFPSKRRAASDFAFRFFDPIHAERVFTQPGRYFFKEHP